MINMLETARASRDAQASRDRRLSERFYTRPLPLAVIIILMIIFTVSMCFLLYDYLARRVIDLLAVRSQQTARMVCILHTFSSSDVLTPC